jgi:hypothetical protein
VRKDFHYTREVKFVTGSPNDVVAKPGTETVGQVAQTPADIATSAAVIVGRVVKLDGPNAVEVVNNSGGGVYTIRTTQPTRTAAIAKLEGRRLDYRFGEPDHRHLGG